MPVLRHPDLDSTISVSESTARVLAKSGWAEDVSKKAGHSSGSVKSARKAEAADDAAESTEPQEG